MKSTRALALAAAIALAAGPVLYFPQYDFYALARHKHVRAAFPDCSSDIARLFRVVRRPPVHGHRRHEQARKMNSI